MSFRFFDCFKIKPHYNEGYFPLLVKVLNVLLANGYNPKPKYTWKELQKLVKALDEAKKEKKK